jgi:hypothetical protein
LGCLGNENRLQRAVDCAALSDVIAVRITLSPSGTSRCVDQAVATGSPQRGSACINYEICADAIREARRILSEYINPCSPSDSIATIDQISRALDNEAVEAALKRIDGRNHFGLVWVQIDGPLTER